MNPLIELQRHGQSYWLDNLTRGMIRSGELERRVREEGLRGITSNPAIFQKAISAGEEYDEQIASLVREGLPVSRIYERLVVSDIRDACDVLAPVYEESGGGDGFVSLEVSPYLAHDTEASLEEARRLFDAVDRPNCFIKIPGTPAGVPAIEEALFEGININITLLFSIDAYDAVAEAHSRALERRLESGLPIDGVASVASFFLSRIDVLTDRLLGQRVRAPGQAGGTEPRAQDLLGRAAIANAKLAYQRFLERIRSDRWKALEAEGAGVQRMLWASTSTKNPLYGDVRYVEPLIGPHTVNTLPDRTIEAFADHGRVERTIETDLEEARLAMERLEEVGIDFEHVTRRLLDEGVQKFIDPFDRLMTTLAERRSTILGGCLASQRIEPGELEGAARGAAEALREQQTARRMEAREAGVWTDDPEEEAAVRNRLGWLEAPESFRAKADEITSFAARVRDDGVERVVLLGMGGSSLAAEVARSAFGSADGWPALTVLDDTDPDAVRAVADGMDPATTLFLVASKSGTTAETRAFYRYFRHRVAAELEEGEVGRRFVAITDPGTPLAEEARREGFRRTFENPEEIGGRYSALSYFGLVPMALIGVDVRRLLDRAAAMAGSCEAAVPPEANPGLALGALLGLAGRRGRRTVTFLLGPRLLAFGAWAEQLLAESTGKDGTGLIPVTGEPGLPGLPRLDAPDRGDDGPARPSWKDRVFVALRTEAERDSDVEAFLDARREEGHPVVRIVLDGLDELGAEFYRWEVATAVAGSILGVNPFDEPNVTESKRRTRELLDAWSEAGSFPVPEASARNDRLAVRVPDGAHWAPDDAADPAAVLGALADSARPDDYTALLVYLAGSRGLRTEVTAVRRAVAQRTGVAGTLGHGPRYLHSTGQLHKGGPDAGVFLIVTAPPGTDIEIPGEAYGFGTLQRAQALGDYLALADRGRRVAWVQLEGEPAEALQALARALGTGGRRPAAVA